MKEFEFTIVASGLDPNEEGFEARFYDAGCDDATVSFQKGHIIIDFARDAESAEEAIASAVEAVQKAGATVERVEPDPLVSLADIAFRTNLSRAAITQYAKGQRGDGSFPTPVARVTTDSPLWDWSDVSRWMYRHKRLDREEAMTAVVMAKANELVPCREGSFRAQLSLRLREEQVAI